jgi:AbrB family looped-hinge helix DNA binding protein
MKMENNIIGIIRTMDDLGRVVIPKEFRRATNIKEGDSFEIFATSDHTIILRKATVKEVDGVMIKTETSGAPIQTAFAPEKRVCHFESEYGNDPIVIKINESQYKLLQFLCREDLLNSDWNLNDGFPDITVEDLT